MGYSELFESVADVWLVWLVSSSFVAVITYRAIRTANWRSIASFMQDDRGASYAIPYVMTFPVFLLFICWTIQSSLILITKFGSVHSAHRAARTAVVWRSANPDGQSQGWSDASDRAQRSAALSMAPFATGYSRFRVLYVDYPGAISRAVTASFYAPAYSQLYEMLASETDAGNSLPRGSYVRQKYQYAAAMTTVSMEEAENRFNADLTVTVNHRMPLVVPLTGRLLGNIHFSGRAYYRDVPATVVMQLETPETPDRGLGIAYDPARAN